MIAITYLFSILFNTHTCSSRELSSIAEVLCMWICLFASVEFSILNFEIGFLWICCTRRQWWRVRVHFIRECRFERERQRWTKAMSCGEFMSLFKFLRIDFTVDTHTHSSFRRKFLSFHPEISLCECVACVCFHQKFISNTYFVLNASRHIDRWNVQSVICRVRTFRTF